MKEIKKALKLLEKNGIHYIITGSLAIEEEYNGFIKERRPDGIGDLDIILNFYNFSKLFGLKEAEIPIFFDIYDDSLNMRDLVSKDFRENNETIDKLEGACFRFTMKNIDLDIDVFLDTPAFKKLQKDGKSFLPAKEVVKRKIEISKAYAERISYEGSTKEAKKITKHLEDIIYINSKDE